MWKLFFEICDFLCNFIPNRKKREYIRTEKLYDWKKKYKALKKLYPELKFRNTKIIKGGWNIGFIVDKKYVFKIKKVFNTSTTIEKITREKRITDAFAQVSTVRIPKIEIVKSGQYTFFKYDFIPGKNLNTLSLRNIMKYKHELAKQLAEFIYSIHNYIPQEINDLRDNNTGDGWNHNDICNNIIINKKTKKIVGIIDWEYSSWDILENEFRNCVAFSKKMQEADILKEIKKEYQNIINNKDV